MQTPKVAYVSELRSKVLRNLKHYPLAHSQVYNTIDRLEERGVESERARGPLCKDKKGPSSIRRSLEEFQRQRWENVREMG